MKPLVETCRWLLVSVCIAGGAALLCAQTQPPSDERPNPTRALEGEIEQYPGSASAPASPTETSIPEEAPEHATTPPTLRAPARASARTKASASRSDIPADEVQRVFGRDESVVPLASLDAAGVRQLQQGLKAQGLYAGEVDGRVGSKTRAALDAALNRQFRLSTRMLHEGNITRSFGEALGLAPAGMRNLEAEPRRGGPQPAP